MKTCLLRKYLIIFCAILFLAPASSMATKRGHGSVEIIDALIVGNRVMDISYNLKVLPRYASVRCCSWSMCSEIKNTTKLLGCPFRLNAGKKDLLFKIVKKTGVKHLIVDATPAGCGTKSCVDLSEAIAKLKDLNIRVDYVDFSKGVVPSIQKVAKVLGKPERGEALVKKYQKNLSTAEKKVAEQKGSQKVIVLKGVYQASSGKIQLQVEAPGGHSDTYFLGPMGHKNVADAFKPANKKAQRGYYPVRKKKKEMILAPLLKANPDVIVITGDTYAVQKQLNAYLKKNPEMKKINAVKNLAIFTLPEYQGSSLVELPKMLQKWAEAFTK